MYSISYFWFFLDLLLNTLNPIANAGTSGTRTLAIAVPISTGPPIEHPPPPPPLGFFVGVGVGFFVGVGDGFGAGTHTPGAGVPPEGVGSRQTNPEGQSEFLVHAIGEGEGEGEGVAGAKFSLTGNGSSIPSLVKQALSPGQLWKFS